MALINYQDNENTSFLPKILFFTKKVKIKPHFTSQKFLNVWNRECQTKLPLVRVSAKIWRAIFKFIALTNYLYNENTFITEKVKIKLHFKS